MSNRSRQRGRAMPAQRTRLTLGQPTSVRVTTSADGTASVEAPTAPAEDSPVLGAWQANLPPDETALFPASAGPQTPEPEPEPVADPEAWFGSPDPETPRRVDDSASAAATKAGGSTESSPVGNPLEAKARAAALGRLAGGTFAALSGLVNLRLRLDDEDPTWLADEDDVKGVGRPLGRIAGRRIELPDGKDASDVSDGIEAAVALVGYVIKNLGQRAALVRTRRRGPVAPAEA